MVVIVILLILIIGWLVLKRPTQKEIVAIKTHDEVDVFDVVAKYLENIIHIEECSAAAACELGERFKSEIFKGTEPDGKVLMSSVLKKLNEAVEGLPPGSVGRARMILVYLLELNKIPDSDLVSTGTNRFLKKEAWATIGAAIDQADTKPTKGFELLQYRIDQDVRIDKGGIIRILCGLEKIECRPILK